MYPVAACPYHKGSNKEEKIRDDNFQNRIPAVGNDTRNQWYDNSQ
jgi:hypothetical protein